MISLTNILTNMKIEVNILREIMFREFLTRPPPPGASRWRGLRCEYRPPPAPTDPVCLCRKDARLPEQLQRAMAAEAEAAREARAKVIAAEGEKKASGALREASEIISESPAALQLRYLQVLRTNTTIFRTDDGLHYIRLCR